MCAAKRHVRFTPNSDRDSGLRQTVMSALPPKADMCTAHAHVCFGPKADIAPGSFDHLVGALLELQGHVKAEDLGGLEIDHQFKFGWYLHRQICRFFSLEYAIDVKC